MTPRSANSSSKSRYDNPNRRYQRTANKMTSGGNRNPANADDSWPDRRHDDDGSSRHPHPTTHDPPKQQCTLMTAGPTVQHGDDCSSGPPRPPARHAPRQQCPIKSDGGVSVADPKRRLDYEEDGSVMVGAREQIVECRPSDYDEVCLLERRVSAECASRTSSLPGVGRRGRPWWCPTVRY